MSILVDTDWIIDGLIGRPDALRTLSELGPLGLAVSAVTVGEVFEGAYDRADPEIALSKYQQFLVGYTIISVDEAVAADFARIRAALRRQGNRLPDLDLLIAATAVAHSLSLLTRNRRHFDRVPGLTIHSGTIQT